MKSVIQLEPLAGRVPVKRKKVCWFHQVFAKMASELYRKPIFYGKKFPLFPCQIFRDFLNFVT